MKRIPRRYAPLAYGVIQFAVTTAVATGIATYQLASADMQLLRYWLGCWALSWTTMLPIVLLVAPLIDRAARTAAIATESAFVGQGLGLGAAL